jgi:hypothetical protein
MDGERLRRAAHALEVGAVALAIIALLFRATWYWHLPPVEGQGYGTGDVVDFAFALGLFLVCGTCAASGVALALQGTRDPAAAWRPAVVGMTAFAVYQFLHPHVPRLL